MRRTLACRDCDATYEIEVVRGRKKPYCDACTERRRREAKARYREKNRETIRAKAREYARARYAADPERFREKQRERAAADPETVRGTARRSYAKNAEKRRAEARAHRLAVGRDKLRQQLRDWYARNPERVIAYRHNRRARLAGAGGSFTHLEFIERCAEHNNRCFYCGSAARLTADHVTPLSKGGSNTIDNIVGACLSCNCSKHDLDLSEFVERRWEPSPRFGLSS